MTFETKHDNLDLEDAVETGFFLLPALPGELSALSIPDLKARVTPISSPFANVVGAARLDPQTADDAITAVINYFATADLSFGWRVGPRSTPHDLSRRLQAAGLQRQDNILGLSCDNLAVQPPHKRDLTVRQATPRDLALLDDLLSDAFSYHAAWAPIMARAYLEPRAQAAGELALYLAFVGSRPDPVAFGSTYYLPDQPVAMLSGAATREAYRRHGIYSHLVAYRLQEAHKLGARAAVIQAIPASAAACRKWGFRQFCELEHYLMERS